MSKIFAIKDVAKGVLKEIGNESSTINLDYANDCTLELTGEESFARKNGNNAVSFGGARSGTFTFNTEMMSMEVLALILGGEYDSASNKISVKGSVPSRSFTFEGTVNVKFEGESSYKIMDLKLYNISPQLNGSMSLSSTDIGSYAIAFNVMVDADDNIYDFFEHKEVASATRVKSK